MSYLGPGANFTQHLYVNMDNAPKRTLAYSTEWTCTARVSSDCMMSVISVMVGAVPSLKKG